MTTRLAVLSDVHGIAPALDAVRKAIKREKPDMVLVAGDLVMNGPDPAGAVDALRAMESDGAIIVQGNTDIAVADADYAAAFPWLLESGISDPMRLAAEWAHDALSEDQLDWLRRLPAERRVTVEDTLVLVTHASPGSQTQGFDKDLDPTAILERIARTDARVICCGHTHLPDVREFGWKVIVNAGSTGYVFDGDPTASWALVTLGDDEVASEIRRAEFDVLSVANAISARGLPGDVYRAATVRTGKLVR
ncbi:MAG TPA: metallophosphoesterase family protein [Candidatus Acidoferrales bacterium]|jgi:putative phosphoesterase|nr:metallophosphoesterase family protein [Candidatus Acidoferrales bacterium]